VLDRPLVVVVLQLLVPVVLQLLVLVVLHARVVELVVALYVAVDLVVDVQVLVVGVQLLPLVPVDVVVVACLLRWATCLMMVMKGIWIPWGFLQRQALILHQMLMTVKRTLLIHLVLR
jgi:hypothetical protein